jgi:hypothetical protein
MEIKFILSFRTFALPRTVILLETAFYVTSRGDELYQQVLQQGSAQQNDVFH